MKKQEDPDHCRSAAREGFIVVEGAELYYREVGRGQTLVILHGGPDFDHGYLLPELDQLSDSFRLIYYDQRGRGKSAKDVRPQEVSIDSDIRDLEIARAAFKLEQMAILGHSWGGLLALEYAIRHPKRVSHLILLNTAPVSHEDYRLLRNERLKSTPGDIERLKAWKSEVNYQNGDPDTVADYYRVHFRATLRQPERLEKIIQRLRSSFTKDGILKAREIEKRLMKETWLSADYDLFPSLKQLSIPTLILHGDHDFIPVQCSTHIVEAIAGAHFVQLQDCGHFSYLEHPQEVCKAIQTFFKTPNF